MKLIDLHKRYIEWRMDDQSEEIVSVVLVGRPVTTMLKNKPEAEHDAHSRYSVQS